MAIDYSKYKFEVMAGDYNSPLARNEIWVNAFFKYQKLLGISQPILGIISHENQIEYVANIEAWIKCHGELKEKMMEDYHYIQKLIDWAVEYGEQMNQWTYDNLFSVDLKLLSNDELDRRLKVFCDMQSTEYAIGVTLALLDFQDYSFVENNLKIIVESRMAPEERTEYYRVFTQPSLNSFAQDQEEDLLKLAAKYFSDKNWLSDIKNSSLSELQNSYPVFFNELQEHAAKYAWVYFVYAGPAFTEQNFIDFIKDYLERGIDPNKKLLELTETKKQLIATKQKYLNFLKPSEFEETVLNLVGKFIWAKPRRKDYQSKSYYHAEKLYQEIGRRFYLSLDQVRSCTQEMLEKCLKSGKIDIDLANQLYKGHACVPGDNGKALILVGDEVEKFSNKIIRDSSDVILNNIKQLSGTCACPGKVKGVVRIINKASDMGKMQYGDILVSLATTPSIISAMKKAAAIVTDEGGLTCHASIVSREMNLPCIIGTKIATKVFKDGDMVEVDATNGLVKKI